jgi:hypothetical protein
LLSGFDAFFSSHSRITLTALWAESSSTSTGLMERTAALRMSMRP